MSDFDPFDPVNTVMRSLHKSNMLAAKDVQIAELEAENARLKAEVERLRASSFVTAVPVEEYEKLKAEVERLTNCKSEADRLKAEVERLRKAGDAMALCITEFRCGKYGNALDKVGGFYVWQDWLAAKEGKPSA